MRVGPSGGRTSAPGQGRHRRYGARLPQRPSAEFSGLRSAQVRGHSDLVADDYSPRLAMGASCPCTTRSYPRRSASCRSRDAWGALCPIVGADVDWLDRHCSLSGTRTILRFIRISSNLVGGPPAFRSALHSTFLDGHSHGGTVGRAYRSGPLSSFCAARRGAAADAAGRGCITKEAPPTCLI